MWQTILMCIAVLFVVVGCASTLSKIIQALTCSILKQNFKYNLVIDIILVSIGISYLIWYCQ